MTTDRTEDYRAAYALFAASERRDGQALFEHAVEVLLRQRLMARARALRHSQGRLNDKF
jgi:hypothetical protein